MESEVVEKFTFFWNGPFSQWHRSEFKANDFTYNCAEQYMMDQKAELFGDKEVQRLIRQTKHPRDQKALGRAVKGFDIVVWNRHARRVVFDGNYHKFTQNIYLLSDLVATVGTTLVEASPNDSVWGIGLKEGDPRSLKRETWLGTNWLGEVLTNLRNDLITNNH